jgi:hypothetical protein
MDNQVNFEELLVGLLSKLSEREQNILKQRYHLTNETDKKATLKQIGDVYSITRERVRQIEREAIRKLMDLRVAQEFSDQLKQVEADITCYLERNGGLIKEDVLLADFVSQKYSFNALNANSFLFVLNHLVDAVEKLENHSHFHASWKLSSLEVAQLVSLIDSLEAGLEAENKILDESGLLNLTHEKISPKLKSLLCEYVAKHDDLKVEDFFSTYLIATNRLEKNILAQWGLANWDKIQPRKLADKIALIFERETKPLHFRDVASKINDAKFDHKKICPATVHNELIANNNYVLIGRGIYALTDWGYTTGTVADIIEQVLKSSGRSMTKSEIFEQVLKQRQVNKSTIYLTLINKDQFVKNENGEFTLNR